MIRVSIGTASVLGLRKVKTDAASTTAYLLNGQKCSNNCGFCPQARDSSDDGSHLSRVVWPEFDTEQVIRGIKSSAESGILKRACIQFTLCKGSFEAAKRLAGKIAAKTEIPISVSLNIPDSQKVRELIDAGAARVSIALDAASADIHNRIKGSDFYEKKKLIEECAGLFPGRISTHIIIGLGETEQEAISEIAGMYNIGVCVGLFAFTPVRGTALEQQSQPDAGSYRRVQIARFLLERGIASLSDFTFDGGRLSKIGLETERMAQILSDGRAFETSGCSGCNRPYYNERPAGTIYNYPRPLSKEEAKQCLEESGLGII